MVDFSQLRKNAGNGLSKLTEELDKLNQNNFQNDDENYWKPTVDKAGNGYAVFRWLPAPSGEDSPFIRYWDHSFSRNGKWYIEKSRTTLGEADPCAEYNTELWASGEAGKELVSGNQAKEIIGSKRRLHYVANIYIIEDHGNPSNNGKVFKYRFGAKIMEKIKEAVKPTFPGQQPIDPFCFWNGADFELKIKNVMKQRNYDSSQFKAQSALFDGDEEKLETIWKLQYPLAEMIAPDKFKSYGDLQKRLNFVLGIGKAKGSDAPAATAEERVERTSSKPSNTFMDRSGPKEEKMPWDDQDDDMSFFKNLTDE